MVANEWVQETAEEGEHFGLIMKLKTVGLQGVEG